MRAPVKPLISLALLLIVVTLHFSAPRAEGQDVEVSSLWSSYPVGSVIYAEVIEPPDALYRDPANDNTDEWIRMENTLLFGQAINVSERHQFLDRDHVVRVRIEEGGFGRILPDGHHSPYIPEPTQYHPTYVDLRFLAPLESNTFEPFSIYEDTQAVDKMIVVIADAHPRLMVYEGNELIMKIPAVLGPTPNGDHRVYRTRVADDMPGIPGVPFSNYFSGGYTIHGAPWWNWRETVRGHYGSHGCINLPDDEWYQIFLGGEYVSIDEWMYRWISTNIDYDEFNPDEQEARVGSENEGWYQATDTVRVLVVDYIEQISDNPLPRRLGPLAADAQVTDWQPIIDAYHATGTDWLLPHQNQDDEGFTFQNVEGTRSIAQIEGDTESDQWIMLECSDNSTFDNLLYEGSSRTVGELCYHLQVERQGSICTPERVDIAYFGERVICNADKFNLLHIRERGELIEHERVHMIQFQAYYKELALQGVAIDDATPFEFSYTQLSTIGVTELWAQSQNVGSRYQEDYMFVLARPDENGNPTLVNNYADTIQTWEHLFRECGGDSPELRQTLEDALWGDAEAYQTLDAICSMPIHQLVPDRHRRAD